MSAPDGFGNYRIELDKDWSLEDLYVFPRTFEQVYFALEAILPAEDEEIEERIAYAFKAFPWRGGYSAVNFYNQLKYATPKRERPAVQAIQYASPGFIELFLALALAGIVGQIVRSVSKTLRHSNATYNAIQTDLIKRKLLRIEVKRAEVQLAQDELQLIADYSEIMARVMGIESAEPVHERTGNRRVSLKILLSIYRRIRTLAEFQTKGKIKFLPDDSDD